MPYGILSLRRSGAWPLWLAIRSIFTAVVAIIAAVVLNSTALPRISQEMSASSDGLPQVAGWMLELRGFLPVVPAPALLLGIGALVVKPLRPLLAVLAALTSVVAIVLIVGTLVIALVPMYQIPRDLGME